MPEPATLQPFLKRAIRIVILLAIYRTVLAFCILFLAACTVDSDESPSPSPVQLSSGSCASCKQFFSFKNLSLTHIDGSSILLRIYADTVIGRPRMGRLVMFENYDEIYLNHLIFEQPQKGKVVNLDLQSLVKAFRAFGDGNQGDQGQSAEEASGDIEVSPGKHRMSRMLVDNISINMKPWIQL